MANQDVGAGQQYDEDITSDQLAQQGGQQYSDEQDIEGALPDDWSQQVGKGGQNPDAQRGGVGRQGQRGDDMDDQEQPARQGSKPDQWDQQRGGLGQEPIMPDSPLDEEEEWQEEDVSRLDKIE